MDVAVVAITAFAAAFLTLFSGFGLGTLLLPAFAVFLPADVAVAATAVVHLANNLFKVGLLGRHANLRVVLAFALPAARAALAGALLLQALAHQAPLATWSIGARLCTVTPIGLVLGGLILGFALFELHPRSKAMAFPPRLLPLGGALSGFLGGLSGHQGALRTAFLIRLGLAKEAFLATGIVSAVAVDLVRLTVYGLDLWQERVSRLDAAWPAVATGVATAFLGSFLGARMVRKVTMNAIHVLVGLLLVLLGVAIAAGVV